MPDDFASMLRGRVGKELDYGGYRFLRAERSDELEQAYRLRHRVYVEEGFIDPRLVSGDCFQDEFDDVSAQILVLDGQGAAIGTTRFVLPSPLGFPTEQLFDFAAPGCARERLGEFGRLAIEKGHRGGARVPMLGMIKMIYECIREHEIEFIYAFMPPRLIASYTALGLVSRPLALRPPRSEILARRLPMRGYFARQEIRPVLFQLEEMERQIGV